MSGKHGHYSAVVHFGFTGGGSVVSIAAGGFLAGLLNVRPEVMNELGFLALFV